MTTKPEPRPAGGPPVHVKRHLLPRWRPFTWVILAFNVVMLIWVITGASTGKDCGGLAGNRLTECQASDVGTGIGVSLIIILWAIGDVILGVLWLITKPHKRTCPACGNRVRRGIMRCHDCGYDFAQMLPGAERPDR